MHYAERVCAHQRRAHLPGNIEQVPDREPLFARQHGRNAVALDVLHGGAKLGVDLAGAIEHDNVLAGQIAGALAFGDQRLYEGLGPLA